jgi:N-succinyldiaminopimelate aminotransferase
MEGRGNQYPPGRASRNCGRRSPRTRSVFYGLDVDPDTQVLVTAGATEAIAAA